MTATIRLAELTGAIAHAADAGIGLPPETDRASRLTSRGGLSVFTAPRSWP
jgi:hypothetical protein